MCNRRDIASVIRNRRSLWGASERAALLVEMDVATAQMTVLDIDNRMRSLYTRIVETFRHKLRR